MDALPRANLGAALLEQGRLEAADQEFRHALKLDPNSVTRALALADGRSAARYIPEFRERLALYRRGKASSNGAAP